MRITVYPCVYREHVGFKRFQFVQSRFIPVYTGNTHSLTHSVVSITVYPCVYREHAPRNCPVSIRGGLSLCIQGTRQQQRQTRRIDRFIPVYTGNT